MVARTPIKVDLYKSNKAYFITLSEHKYVASSILSDGCICGKLPIKRVPVANWLVLSATAHPCQSQHLSRTQETSQLKQQQHRGSNVLP